MLGIFGGIAAVMLVAVIPLVRSKMMPKRDRVGDGRTLDLDTDVDSRWRSCTGISAFTYRSVVWRSRR